MKMIDGSGIVPFRITSDGDVQDVNEIHELLDSAECEDVEITWGSDSVEPVEAIMQTAGLRK